MTSKEPFTDIIRDWLKAIRLFPGPLTAGVIRKVVERMTPQLRQCLAEGEWIDIWQCAELIAESREQVIEPKEVIEVLLSILPPFQCLPPLGRAAFVRTYSCLEERYRQLEKGFVGQSVGIN